MFSNDYPRVQDEGPVSQPLFPPEVNAPASRTYEHCRAWVEHGHEVSVLTCVPNHPAGIVYPGYRNGLWQTELINGVRVQRIWTLLAANRGFARRSANYLCYMLITIISAPFLSRTDVVISTSPQFFCGLAGYFVSRLKGARWILEIRDLWPESIVTVGAMKPSRVTRLLERLEGFAYRKAHRIVSVTDSFVERIAASVATPARSWSLRMAWIENFYRPSQEGGAPQ